MTKTNTNLENMTTETQNSDLAPSLTLAQFHDDVANVFLHYVRNISWMTDVETAWAITKAPALAYAYDLMNPDCSAADLGLTHAHIKDTEFARAMQRMYDYAYFGLVHLGEEALEHESIHMWVSALLVDAASGAVSSEWGSYGNDIESAASRLVRVAETANARLILEGEEEGFYYFVSQNKDDKHCDTGQLNVRQVALLSGMEEMSIRAAANPNRVNQLKPTKTEHGTRFEVSVVKEWLKQKKRYVPVTKRWFVNDFDLTKTYKSWDEIAYGLETRYNLLGQEQGYESLDERLAAIGLSPSGKRILLEKAFFDNEHGVRQLADILSLPQDLLVLRTREAMALETLRNIERDIKHLAEQAT